MDDLSVAADERTLDLRTYSSYRTNRDDLFDPIEITGRSTSHNFRHHHHLPSRDSMNSSLPSTEDILSQSASENVRQLAASLSRMKVDQSFGGRTADMSFASSASGSSRGGAKKMGDNNPWGEGFKRNAGEAMGQVAFDLEGASFKSTNVLNIEYFIYLLWFFIIDLFIFNVSFPSLWPTKSVNGAMNLGIFQLATCRTTHRKYRVAHMM